jgi:hypothetical protein
MGFNNYAIDDWMGFAGFRVNYIEKKSKLGWFHRIPKEKKVMKSIHSIPLFFFPNNPPRIEFSLSREITKIHQYSRTTKQKRRIAA